ncbi:MAG TPA: MBL fold metallo-hydrolase [Candidatus Omnitrophota bacterium]|nr:MBL fold metallo-hydrolase [Candidatus Omnitrophota bacterium]HRZ14447.1 MBL fold metallo-hydrolase [Candidatus Omnitrophota bacterium]
MIVEQVTVGQLEVNCYILAAGPDSQAVIIDPGADVPRIKQALARYRLTPGIVINTHGHYDHIGGDDALGVPIYAHEEEVALLKDAKRNYSVFFTTAFRVTAPIHPVRDRQIIRFGGIELEVLHVPGHSPGGISLLMRAPRTDMVFTGDSLFAGSIGRTDLEGDAGVLVATIKEKLLVLPDQTLVYPGHGSSTTIGEEKAGNPFL